MPTSAIEYDVKLTVLVAWLRDEFGEPVSEQGAVVWSVTPIGAGQTSWWSVVAPREISTDEQHELKIKSLKEFSSSSKRRRFGQNRVSTV
ncbi:hypothetical protein QBC43DRAFT_310383 [Cladorrhinum sp. PSN259]|nr:hypothetical protein QBC43DRAFT_310383 [Cladorrhinum sp. PSN259]